VFCEGRRDNGTDGSPTHLVLKRSLGNAGSPSEARSKDPATSPEAQSRQMKWQPMQILLVSKAGEAYMNPVPIIDRRDGTVFLLVNPYFQPYKDVPVHIWLMKSSDDGATWSSPTDITTGTGLRELGPGIGIQMQNGRLVAPTYDGVVFSDDHGKTWKSSEKISDVYNESQVVELVDGSLMLNVRQGGHRAILISKNGGQAWGKPRSDMALSEPTEYQGCQASLIRYSRKGAGSSKNRLLFSNPSDPNHRLDMTVRVSYDEGRTWPVAKLIKKGRGGYSSLTVLPDGSIGLVYESGNFRTLSFVRFSLSWLTDGQENTF
jgi:sialidase-1